jgi:hypothetical protein
MRFDDGEQAQHRGERTELFGLRTLAPVAAMEPLEQRVPVGRCPVADDHPRVSVTTGHPQQRLQFAAERLRRCTRRDFHQAQHTRVRTEDRQAPSSQKGLEPGVIAAAASHDQRRCDTGGDDPSQGSFPKHEAEGAGRAGQEPLDHAYLPVKGLGCEWLTMLKCSGSNDQERLGPLPHRCPFDNQAREVFLSGELRHLGLSTGYGGGCRQVFADDHSERPANVECGGGEFSDDRPVVVSKFNSSHEIHPGSQYAISPVRLVGFSFDDTAVGRAMVATVPLEPLTFLFGMNGAGKTRLLEVAASLLNADRSGYVGRVSRLKGDDSENWVYGSLYFRLELRQRVVTPSRLRSGVSRAPCSTAERSEPAGIRSTTGNVLRFDGLRRGPVDSNGGDRTGLKLDPVEPELGEIVG